MTSAPNERDCSSAGKCNTVVIENKTRRLIGVQPYGFSLVPGENDVPLDGWEKFSKRTECKGLLQRREVCVRKDIEKAVPLIEKIKDFEEEKAVAIVEAATNTHHLERWGKTDGRGRVQEAIRRRLEYLKMPAGVDQGKRNT
jgi:hypothetical protein